MHNFYRRKDAGIKQEYTVAFSNFNPSAEDPACLGCAHSWKELVVLYILKDLHLLLWPSKHLQEGQLRAWWGVFDLLGSTSFHHEYFFFNLMAWIYYYVYKYTYIYSCVCSHVHIHTYITTSIVF